MQPLTINGFQTGSSFFNHSGVGLHGISTGKYENIQTISARRDSSCGSNEKGVGTDIPMMNYRNSIDIPNIDTMPLIRPRQDKKKLNTLLFNDIESLKSSKLKN